MLEEFYRHLSVVGVSSMTGQGVEEFFAALEAKRQEFERDYKPELERKQKDRDEAREARREIELGRLLKDMNVTGRPTSGAKPSAKGEAEVIPDVEDDSDEDETGDGTVESSNRDDTGLSQRYKQALKESGSQNVLSDQDHSFARYLRSGNIE